MILGLITSTITLLNSLFILSKVYTRRTSDKAIILKSSFLDVLLGIVIDKGLNLFDECATRCVNLFPQEEEWTSYS